MKTIVAGMIALALSGCSQPRPHAAAVRAETYTFEDPRGAQAQVFRAVGADGGEAIHGETHLPGTSRRVIEDAAIDAAGRISRVEVRVVRCDGAVEDRFVADRARGTVRADTPGGVVEWPVPTDAPWAVEPAARGGATPVLAWLAMRAASSGADVRVIRADARSSYRAPADQVAIATEAGATVLVGESASSADALFIERVQALDGSLDLRRAEGRHVPVACASIGASLPDVMR